MANVSNLARSNKIPENTKSMKFEMLNGIYCFESSLDESYGKHFEVLSAFVMVILTC